MRRCVVFALPVVLTVVLTGLVVAADVFQEFGLDRQAWADSFVNSMTTGTLYAPTIPAKLKAVPAAQRAAIVAALGTAARAYFATPEFAAQYKTEYDASVPDDLKPPRPAKDIAASQRAEMEKGLAEMEKAVQGLQGEMRKQADAALAQARAQIKEQIKQVDAMAAQQAAEEKRRYEEAKSRPPDPDALPADPRLALKKSLQRFLDETADVDFGATLKTEYGLKRFTRAGYESKPKPWKMCFRAGQDACDAARAFATSWLEELK